MTVESIRDCRANRLPAPGVVPFNLTMRLYLPWPEVRDGRGRLPAIMAE